MPSDPFTGEAEELPELHALTFMDPFPAIAGATAEVCVFKGFVLSALHPYS